MFADPENVSPLNPFPWYDHMRATSPVFFDSHSGAWHVFSYEAVQRVLSDYSAFSSQRASGGGPLGASIISLDPPRHRQMRALVSQAFTPRAIAQLEPRITAIATQLLDTVMAQGTMDIITDFAAPLPVIVIAELLGIPTADRERFKLWSDAIVQGGAAASATVAALGAQWYGDMIAYFQRMIAARKQAPRDDLISALNAVQVDGEHLSLQELVGFCMLLLIAGNETTTNLIGNALLCFDEDPAVTAQLRQSSELTPTALEEVLRYRSPVQSMFRVATQDVELEGQVIPANAWVIAWIGAANRDPRQFPMPDQFDITRSPNRHLAFGYGIHFCLGAPLARMEGRIALNALLSRTRQFQISTAQPLESLEGNIVFGVKHLPLTFAPA